MSILLFLNSFLSFSFSVLIVIQNLSWLSILACVIGLAYSFGLAFFSLELTRKKTQKGFKFTRLFLSYLIVILIILFIVSRLYIKNELVVMDIILSLMWFLTVVIAFITLRFVSEKRAEKYFEGLSLQKQKRSFLAEILSWVDAFFWAVSHMILLNLFLFQLYEIPSESMVPTFMVKDRVAGLKFLSGPKFPLSSFNLPRLAKYKRGDVVIFKNPRYPQTKANEFKSLTSQAISMITFMQVNTNLDPLTGTPKADPLVKRIVGLPGEKLMLVDGVLYVKGQSDADYHILTEDSKNAVWNINELPKNDLNLVKNIPFTDEVYKTMLEVEALRKSVNFRSEYDELEKILHNTTLQKGVLDNIDDIDNFLSEDNYILFNLFKNDDEIARRIFTTNGGLTWLKKFTLSWAEFWVTDKSNTASLYEIRNAQLSVLIKKTFAKLILRNLELFRSNVSDEVFYNDAKRIELLSEAEKFLLYTQLSNGRNMNEFPKDGFLQNDEYFLMGDNRFNSLDLRHSSTPKNVPLDTYDEKSILVSSNVFPMPLEGKNILGIASFIFWPPSRAKIVK